VAGKHFATDADVQQAVTDYRHLTPIFFTHRDTSLDVIMR
jgi:hypothetical protein